MTSMISVRVVGLQLDSTSGVSAVLLAESDEPTRVLPVIIGPAEAQSIALGATGMTPPRPGTHDLMLSVIEATGSTLEEVAITELVDGVFFAELFLETPSGLQAVASRPSDGVALAVRVGAPIVVASAVLDDAAVEIERESPEPFSTDEIDEIVAEFHRALETADVSDFEPDVEDQ